MTDISTDIEQMYAGEDGWSEWVHPLPGYRMQCCDCGLIHEMQVAIAEPNNASPPTNAGETEEGLVIFRMRREVKDQPA